MEKIERKNTAAVILAAGSGRRMQCDKTKQNIEILSETILERSIGAFEDCDSIDSIIVVVKEDELEEIKERLSGCKKLSTVVVGGSTRAESARAGFLAISEGTELVAVHDAARCLITPEMIDKVVRAATAYGAATAASRVVDTIKLSEDGFILKTVPREKVFAAGTPQVFLVDLYKRALEYCEGNMEVTDDNMMIEAIGEKIFLVDIGRENLKITTKEDLELAEFIIEKRMKK